MRANRAMLCQSSSLGLTECYARGLGVESVNGPAFKLTVEAGRKFLSGRTERSGQPERGSESRRGGGPRRGEDRVRETHSDFSSHSSGTQLSKLSHVLGSSDMRSE